MSISSSPGRSVDLNRPIVAALLYLILAGSVCFWRQGAVGVIKMEGMVADGGRQMVESGDWIVPRVYGEIYTFKPALVYWFAAAAHRIADPPPEWLLRFPSAFSAFAMGLIVLVLLGKITGHRTALFCSLAAISAALFIQHVRLAEFDIALSAGVGVAVAAACVNLVRSRARAGVWFLAYAGLAFAFLAKGIPALVSFGPGLLAAAVSTGRFRRLFGWRHLAAALLFALVVSGYLFAAYRSVGSVAFEQPLLESKVRGFGWQTRQENDVFSALEDSAISPDADTSADPVEAVLRTAAKPVLIWAAFLPVSLLLPFAFVGANRERSDPATRRLVRAAQAFLIAGVLTFMLVPTHESRYYLPLSVPIGVLCGVVLAEYSGARPRRGVVAATTAGAVLGGAAMTLAGVFMATPPIPPLNRGVLAVAGLLVLAWIWFARKRPGREHVATLMLLAVAGVLATESLAGQVKRASKRDLRFQAAELAHYLPEDEPVWILGPADLAGKSSSLFFYLDYPIETFRPGVRMPPADSYCILSSDRSDELPEGSGLAFDEIARSEDPWRSYLLGYCSGDPAG